MTPQFAPVSRRTVADEVRVAVLESIRLGQLRPGEQLPAERVLGEQFGVARTSVREALQHLVSLGVIERRGNRTVVVEHLPSVDLTVVDDRKRRVRELFETRRLIEIPMAELATCRAQPDQRRALVDVGGEFSSGMAIDDFRRLDRLFHSLLADASGNQLLAELYGKILHALFADEGFSELLHAAANQAEVAVIVARAGDAHRAIAAGVAAGDPIAVVAAVEDHLADVETRMIQRLI